MAIQDDKTLLCKGDLKAYHESISPYLGGNLMLGTNVSDYYSEDEKIIGVWINGKPIYQKTVSCALGNAAIVNTPHNISNLDFVIDMFGHGKDASGNSFPVPYAPVGNISWGVQIYVSATNISCVTAQNWTGSTVKITLRYVKTTDAANSALTTPGCYDINFPNTWPENKEIFFGNGAYGYHATGTFNTTIDTRESTLLLSLTRTSTTKLISQGGTIKRSVISPTSSDITIGGPFVSYNLTNGIVSTPFYAVSIESDGIKLWRRDATMSNIPYDLWFTYTK